MSLLPHSLLQSTIWYEMRHPRTPYYWMNPKSPAGRHLPSTSKSTPTHQSAWAHACISTQWCHQRKYCISVKLPWQSWISDRLPAAMSWTAADVCWPSSRNNIRDHVILASTYWAIRSSTSTCTPSTTRVRYWYSMRCYSHQWMSSYISYMNTHHHVNDYLLQYQRLPERMGKWRHFNADSEVCILYSLLVLHVSIYLLMIVWYIE